jgi:hypothetical protein
MLACEHAMRLFFCYYFVRARNAALAGLHLTYILRFIKRTHSLKV